MRSTAMIGLTCIWDRVVGATHERIDFSRENFSIALAMSSLYYKLADLERQLYGAAQVLDPNTDEGELAATLFWLCKTAASEAERIAKRTGCTQ